MFVPLKVPEFFFEKKETKKNPLVLPCCVHCARFDILSSFFSETKCEPTKKYREIIYYLIEKHIHKFRHV